MSGTHAARPHTAAGAFGPHHLTVPAPARGAGVPAAADVPPVRVSVDNNHCELYAICQQEAPGVFGLGPDGRLRYDAAPDAVQTPAVRQAARCCPMQAIALTQEAQ